MISSTASKGCGIALRQIRNFLGLFNLAPHEHRLVESLRTACPPVDLDAVDDQLSRFNRVHRLLDSSDERLDHGSTMFYWTKAGRSQIDEFPKRIASVQDREEARIFTCEVGDASKNVIRVEFWAVRGVFVLMEFYSSTRVWVPVGDYDIVGGEFLPDTGDGASTRFGPI